jgi:hypothetical protein
VELYNPNHPLAKADGRVFEHRLIAYERSEGVCPDCHWCGASLEWSIAVVDHLNELVSDNRSDNLVVSCNSCNRGRGSLAPFLKTLRPEIFDEFVRMVIQSRQGIDKAHDSEHNHSRLRAPSDFVGSPAP